MTYNRLPTLLENLKPLFQKNSFAEMKLFPRGDIDDIGITFCSTWWSSHIQEIYHILGMNIALSSKPERCKSLHLRQVLSTDDRIIFPERELKPSEMSLACKHYTSLKQINKPTIVLEDDSSLNQQSLEIILNMVESFTDRCFVNLATINGLPYYGRSHVSQDGSTYIFSPVGLTRTTAAYAVAPTLANKMLDLFFPQALPIDLHLQYLLHRLKIPGLSHHVDLFHNKSCQGLCDSSIQ